MTCLPARQGGQHLLEVQAVRCADVDDVDVVGGEDLVDGRAAVGAEPGSR